MSSDASNVTSSKPSVGGAVCVAPLKQKFQPMQKHL